MFPGAPSPDPTQTKNEQRRARFAAITLGHAIPRVRVVPANEDIRRALQHPLGYRLRSQGSTEWPLDKFTEKRIREGALTIEEPPQAKPGPATQKPGSLTSGER
jgi:hypothetical protein